MRFLSHFSMAVALATAGAMAVSAIPQDAQAQKKKKKKKNKAPKISKEFGAQAAPIQPLIEGENPASAKPLVDALLTQPWTGYDQFVAGQFAVTLGGKLKDTSLQEKGLKTMLASGFTPQEQQAQFSFYIGNFAYGSERWAEAEQSFQSAYDLGYRENNIGPLLAESYFKQNKFQEGLAKWSTVIDDANATSAKAPELWYRMARDKAVASKDKQAYANWATKWASAYPSGTSWGDAIDAYRRTFTGDSITNLEVLRFMKSSGALTKFGDYKEFAEEALRKDLFGEVVSVLEEGQQKGIVSANNPIIAEVLRPAKSKVRSDKASLPNTPSAVRGSGSASVMMNFADVWLGYKDYSKAVAFYQAGLGKPGVDRNRGHLGIGTAHVYANDMASAKAAFAQVSGTRSPLAAMWQNWITQQMTPAPAVQPAATASDPAT